MGLKIVINGPRRAYDKDIESTPVSGVDIKKERTAPFDAPFFLNDIAIGTTPQEHSGIGIPNRAARKTDLVPLPRYLTIFS
jgi:hypothetical protein